MAQSMFAKLPVETRLQIFEDLLVCDPPYSVAVGKDILCPGGLVLTEDSPHHGHGNSGYANLGFSGDKHGRGRAGEFIRSHQAPEFDGEDLSGRDSEEKHRSGDIDDDGDSNDGGEGCSGKESGELHQHPAGTTVASKSRHKDPYLCFVKCSQGGFRVSACPLAA